MMEDLDCLPANVQGWIKGMQETFNEIIYNMPNELRLVPDSLKTKGICEKAVEDDPWQLKYVPDHLKTQDICNGVVEAISNALRYVPDCFITEEMCKKAVEVDQ